MISTFTLFAATIFTSAFLLFQVQPLVGKQILPWFGGSPAVWTTAMLFFQTMLCGGYVYAYGLSRLSRHTVQARIHLVLLVLAALMATQVLPDQAMKPADSDAPVLQVLWILLRSVGLPYFCLATTGPLLQHWFTRTPHIGSVFRLYALSNVGSFLALLSFPYVFEPWLDLGQMAQLWTVGFWLFAVLCAPIALGWRQQETSTARIHADDQATDQTISVRQRLSWVVLPALASLMFIAVTDQVSHDVAPEPRVWIMTLGLYLLTFVLTFDNPRWYRPKATAFTAIVAILITTGRSDWSSWLGDAWDYGVTELRWMHYALLLTVCMLCHGELYRRRPRDSRHLTEFYLCMSLGGAFGGLFVTLVATPFFNDYYEWPIGLVLAVLLAWFVLGDGPFIRQTSRRAITALGAALTIGGVLYFADPFELRGHDSTDYQRKVLDQARNFYGVVAVAESRYRDHPEQDHRSFYSGQTTHGHQFLARDRKREASTYYAPESGVGETLLYLMKTYPSLDVAVVGLGAGTLANYARVTDTYDFYEINPEAVRIANTWFDNLAQCKARQQRFLIGDARLKIEQQPPSRRYDIIILDAFTGHSVPIHLLTREAFAMYARHLKPKGFISVHITNSYLNFYPVVKAQALQLGFGYRSKFQPSDKERNVLRNQHFVMTRDESYLQQYPSVHRYWTNSDGQVIRTESPDWTGVRLWTDQFSTIQAIEWP